MSVVPFVVETGCEGSSIGGLVGWLGPLDRSSVSFAGSVFDVEKADFEGGGFADPAFACVRARLGR